MKKTAILFIASLIVAGTSGCSFLSNLSNDQKIPRDAAKIQRADPNATPLTEVSVIKIQKNQKYYIDTLATVKPKSLIKVFPSTSGQISSVKVKEGDHVKKGQILFTIGGVNGAKHATQSQFELALNNYNTALMNLDVVTSANWDALIAAYAQMQSAQHQLDGANIDSEAFDQNIETAQDTADILDDSLDNLSSQAGKTAENQLKIQLLQSENQADVLELNQESMLTKLGIDGDMSDPLWLAKLGFIGVQIKNNASRLQAESQLSAAKINLDMMNAQRDSLNVRAPIDGYVGDILLNMGDIVGPQSYVTQLVDGTGFEAKAYLSIDTAKTIKEGDAAKVTTDNGYVDAVVSSVSPIADPSTKLVEITLNLHGGDFFPNQVADIKIPDEEVSADSYFIPLDAVIIGTEEKYVFVFIDGIAHKKIVQTGKIRSDKIEILSGLNEGDLIILDGARDVLNGQRVTLK